MAATAREQIIAALADVPDPAQRMTLLLLLTVIDEIGGRLESILQDEESLRTAVLNGHSTDHHMHHEWLAARIESERQGKVSRRGIRDELLGRIIWSALTGAAVYLATRL